MSIMRPHARHTRVSTLLLCAVALAGCFATSSVPSESVAPARVSVGYGTTSTSAAGTVQSLSGTELSATPRAQAEELLQGRFAGVHLLRTVSGGLFVSIRGGSTLLPGRLPLYIVDGMPVDVSPERGLNWLAPEDIARIDVLKDAAGTSMYGGRGASGVLLITTKRNR